MFQSLLSLRALILAILISLAITLFIGCFANPPKNMDESFSGQYWYYLNRGYPEPWAGLALADTEVELPLIKLPILRVDDEIGASYVKIIDLGRFVPILIVVTLISYIPSFLFAKAVRKNKKLSSIFVGTSIGMLVISILIYFTWFVRV